MKRLPNILRMLANASMILSATAIAGASLMSEYTDLTTAKCEPEAVVKPDEGYDLSSMMCSGVGGYRLNVVSDDNRYSVNVIDPSGKSHELDLWNHKVVTGRISSLGPKAEWLSAKKGLPIALIVRIKAIENIEKPNQMTSYLAVVKITSDEICVTDKIEPSSTMNKEARMAAQTAATKTCRK